MSIQSTAFRVLGITWRIALPVCRILTKVPRYSFRLFLLKEAMNSGGVFETPITELNGARFLTPFSSMVDAKISGRGDTMPASQAERCW